MCFACVCACVYSIQYSVSFLRNDRGTEQPLSALYVCTCVVYVCLCVCVVCVATSLTKGLLLQPHPLLTRPTLHHHRQCSKELRSKVLWRKTRANTCDPDTRVSQQNGSKCVADCEVDHQLLACLSSSLKHPASLSDSLTTSSHSHLLLQTACPYLHWTYLLLMVHLVAKPLSLIPGVTPSYGVLSGTHFSFMLLCLRELLKRTLSTQGWSTPWTAQLR